MPVIALWTYRRPMISGIMCAALASQSTIQQCQDKVSSMSTTFGAPPPTSTTRRPILATKLFVPVASGELVARAQLLARLNAGARGRVTIISAPPGFGKTTLVSTWHADQPSPAELAWFSVDDGDNDPARFLAYLCAALKHDDPLLDTAILPPDQMELVSAGLVNALSQRPERVMLVLDDYHAIDNPAIHALLGRLIDTAPPQLHVVVTSRLDPPIPLSRLRAGGLLNEVHADELRFTAEEVQALFATVLDLELPTRDAEMLAERTEGWAAGIVLAGLSIQRRGDASAFIADFSGSNRYVFDYLAEEVLRRQPEELRTFLLYTSILDRVCAPLANSLTGRSDGRQMLAATESANLFISPLDDERRWYRYHHLFAEFLAAQLHEHDPELVCELHRRASAWFHAQGFNEEAVDHALHGADFPRAVSIIRDIGPQLMMQGQPTTVRDWVQALPPAVKAAEPDLCLIQCGALFYTGEFDAIEPLLRIVDAWLLEHMDDPAWETITGRAASIRSMVAFYRNDPASAHRFATVALTHLPKTDLRFIAAATYVLGVAVFVNDFKAGRDLVEQSIPLLDADGNVLLGLQARHSLCSFYLHEGRLRDVERICREVERSAFGQSALASDLINMTLAAVLQEWDQMDEAEQRTQRAIEIAHRQGILVTEMLASGRLASIRMSQWRMLEALAIFNQMDAEAREHDLVAMFDDDVDTWRAVIQIRLGELEPAAQWARDKGYTPDASFRLTQGLHFRGYARLLIAQQRLPEAFVVLDRLLELALQNGLVGVAAIEALLLRTLAEAQRGERERAYQALAQALAYAEPRGFFRTIVDEGEPIATVLRGLRGPAAWERHAAPLGVTRAYVDRLIDTIVSEATVQDTSRIDANAALIEPLSDRELDVLRLLELGRSNRAIADELFVAVGTVKAHTYNVYQKLGVGNRTQAVIRARELGVL
jgi:LuxR family maltose regulon positive regulatory protein